MVYAYDLWAQMPVRDLYDTQMMLASVNAAKDMYEKAALEMKEFKKEYGDFYSPIASEQEAYDKNFNIAAKLNDMYNQGKDPLRNKSDRMELMQWANTRPISQYAQWKRNADNVQKLLESADKLRQSNLFNKEYAKYQLLQAGGKGDTIDEMILNWNGPFNMTSFGAYQDLNEYTSHIFDKMDDSFIESDPNTGLDWFGVSRDARSEALTSLLGGLLSSDLGRFHYLQSINNYMAEHDGAVPTTAEAIEQFKNDILTATREYEHRNYKENPEYKRERDFYWDDKLDASKAARDYYYDKLKRANTPGYDENGDPVVSNGAVDGTYNWDDYTYESGLKNAAGFDPAYKPKDGNGNTITMTLWASNNPVFWEAYVKRVVDAKGSVRPFTHQFKLDTETLVDYLKETPIKRGTHNSVDYTGMNMIRMNAGYANDIISERFLGALIYQSANVTFNGKPYDRTAEEELHADKQLRRAYLGAKFKNKKVNETDRVNPNEYGFRVYTGSDRGIVTAYVNGRFRSYVPIQVYKLNGSSPEPEIYYYQLPAKSVTNHGTSKEFLLHGVNLNYDNKFAEGRHRGNEDMSKAVRASSEGLTSTSTDLP